MSAAPKKARSNIARDSSANEAATKKPISEVNPSVRNIDEQPISFSTRHIQKIAKEIARERRRPIYIQLTIVAATVFVIAFAAYTGGSYISKAISNSKFAELASYSTAKNWYLNTTKKNKKSFKTNSNKTSKIKNKIKSSKKNKKRNTKRKKR